MKDITLVDIGEGKFNEFYLTIDVDALANEPFPLKEEGKKYQARVKFIEDRGFSYKNSTEAKNYMTYIIEKI
jgi:hypothetical protein